MASSAGRTTGIGSLPHHNVDAALAYSFRHGIPFLPQIPIRNPWEYMIAQALEGLPGLQASRDGAIVLDIDRWYAGTHELERKLARAFESGSSGATASFDSPDPLGPFEPFEPSPTSSSCWQPFLWELEERRAREAKVQIAGPMTCQWAMRLSDHSPVEKHEGLSTQIFRLVLARATAMVRRLRQKSLAPLAPLIFLDEPGLYAYRASEPRHRLALQELGLVVRALKKEGSRVGLHCCSETDWHEVLSLPIDFLSIDCALSLPSLLTAASSSLQAFTESGGALSLGVIPTTLPLVAGDAPAAEELFVSLLETLGQNQTSRALLSRSLFTPACGLALHRTEDAETILQTLNQFAELASKAVRPD